MQPGSAYEAGSFVYADTREEDPQIASHIRDALGDVDTVVNIGAGTGSYEPADLSVVAVEPSAVMIGQRPRGTAPVIRGVAEALPLADGAVDAALAVLSTHHWDDVGRGLGEIRRVARRRAVIFTCDPRAHDFWLYDYLPAARRPAERDVGVAVRPRRSRDPRMRLPPRRCRAHLRRSVQPSADR